MVLGRLSARARFERSSAFLTNAVGGSDSPCRLRTASAVGGSVVPGAARVSESCVQLAVRAPNLLLYNAGMDGLVWEHPAFLWLILPAWAWWGFAVRGATAGRRGTVACIALLWLSLATLLAGPAWQTHPPAPLNGLLVVQSVPGLEGTDFHQVWNELAPGLDRFGLGDSLLLRSAHGEGVPLTPGDRAAVRATLERALLSGEGAGNLDVVTRELLAEDAVDWIGLIGPSGDVTAAAERLELAGLRVRAVAIDAPVGPGASLIRIRPPDAVRSGEPIEVWLELTSNTARRVRGSLLLGNGAPRLFEVDLLAHEVVAMPIELAGVEAGRYELTAALESGSATSASFEVAPRPRVLWWGEGELPSALSQLFDQRGWTVGRERGGDDPERWELVVLGKGFEVDDERLVWLDTFVQERGGGLLVLGDPDHSMAGWAETPLGDLLPVVMAPRSEPPPPERSPEPEPDPDRAEPDPESLSSPPAEEPRDPELEERLADTVSLALVLDTSGSMAGRKIAAAKKAAWAAVEALDERDRVAILSFDSDSRLILRLTSASDQTLIRLTLTGIGVGGETRFAPALESALAVLRDDPASVRHVIFLSDGRAWPEATRPIVERMRAQGITLSTVGLGEDHDHEALGRLAAWGGGRYYFATIEDVPQIFNIDVRRVVSDRTPPDRPPELDPPKPEPEPETTPLPDPTEEAPRFSLELVTPDALTLDSSPAGLPELSGYEPARPRVFARPLIRVVGNEDVVMTIGAAGLGRVGVWASGLSGPWGGGFLAWPELGRFLGRTTSALLPAPRPIVTWRVGWFERHAVVEAEVAPERLGAGEAVALSRSTGGREEPLPAIAIGARLWRAVLPLPKPGERLTVSARSIGPREVLGSQSWTAPEPRPEVVSPTRVVGERRALPMRKHLPRQAPFAGVGLLACLALAVVVFWRSS